MKRHRVEAPKPQGEEPEPTSHHNRRGCHISKDGKELKLLWFEPESVPDNFAAVIYGQRRSGKTTWLLWFLWCKSNNFDRVVCYSSTNFKGEFQKYMNPNLCFDRYDEASLQAVLDQQAKVPPEQREKILVILDDVLDSESQFRRRGNNPLVTCYSMGRHYNISVIMCTQYAKSIPTSWRRNVDFACIFYTFSQDMAEIYYREYGALLSRSQFYSILEQVTQGHQCLIVRPCTKSRNMCDYYQMSLADPEVKPFYIGKPPKKDETEDRERFLPDVLKPSQKRVMAPTPNFYEYK